MYIYIYIYCIHIYIYGDCRLLLLDNNNTREGKIFVNFEGESGFAREKVKKVIHSWDIKLCREKFHLST